MVIFWNFAGVPFVRPVSLGMCTQALTLILDICVLCGLHGFT